MSIFIVFLLIIYLVFMVHALKRVFENIYLWQVKEYRLDRVISYLKENKKQILRSSPLIISLFLSIMGILLVFSLHMKVLYLSVLFSFGYFVYSGLVFITKILNKKATLIKKSKRNVLLLSGILIFSLFPLIFSYLSYSSWYSDFGSVAHEISQNDQTEILTIFPEENDNGLMIIPLETAASALYFTYLFLFDLFIPIFVAFFVWLTSYFAEISRKKK